MEQLLRNRSCDSLEIASRSSTDSVPSRDNSVHNSTSSIPSSMATSSTQNSGEASPPPSTSSSTKPAQKPKKFSLNLNGRRSPTLGQGSPTTPYLTPMESQEDIQEKDTGVHRGDQYINKERLALDLSALSSMPELCDVTFLVGEDRQPVCGVRAILAARSRIFRKMLYTDTTAVVGPSKRIKKKQQQLYRPSDGYIEKYDFRGQPTVVVRDFEPEVFKQLINYTHTGAVMLQARTLLGLMNAADHYALDELKQACIRFMEHCITIDSVCSLLSSAEKYIQYKSTKILVQKIFEFVDANAERILPLRGFLTLPQHVVRIVLGRDELKAVELTKFDAAYNWCLNNCKDEEDAGELKKLFEPFVDVIDYHKIPAKHLMQRVKPAGVVEDTHILTALAYQADPNSIPASKSPSGHSNSGQLRKVMTPMEGAPKQVPVRFRRVQSSGTTMETMLNVRRRPTEQPLVSRDTRAGSVPISTAELPDDSTDLDTNRTDGYFYSRGSEVHPLRAHDVKERMNSQSSSHLSIMSTPPLSPTHSPSTTSYQGSILSGSSVDSVPFLLSQDTGGVVSAASGSGSGNSIHTQGGMASGSGSGGSGNSIHTQGGVASGSGNSIHTQGGGASGSGNSIHTHGGVASGSGNSTVGNPSIASSTKRMSYNPQALDAIVNLSSSNAVEV